MKNSVLHKHTHNIKSEIKSIIVNNVTYTDNHDICKQFIGYISTIGNKVHETIVNTSTKIDFLTTRKNLSQPTHLRFLEKLYKKWKVKSCLRGPRDLTLLHIQPKFSNILVNQFHLY